MPFACADSGGWTSEFEGHLPHSHALVWREAGQVVPEPYFFKARTAAVIFALEPVYGIAFAALLFGEQPSLRMLAGGALILFATFLSARAAQ